MGWIGRLGLTYIHLLHCGFNQPVSEWGTGSWAQGAPHHDLIRVRSGEHALHLNTPSFPQIALGPYGACVSPTSKSSALNEAKSGLPVLCSCNRLFQKPGCEASHLHMVNSIGLVLAHCSAHWSSYIPIMSLNGVAPLPPSLVACVHLIICPLSLHLGHPKICHPGWAQGWRPWH